MGIREFGSVPKNIMDPQHTPCRKLCPDLVIVRPDMESYAREAEKIRAVFRAYDPNFLPMSLDEAYMDLTEYLERHPDQTAAEVVHELREKICEATRLTASAGIAPNTFLAKVCSDMNKPNGQFELEAKEEAVMEFVRKLSIRKSSISYLCKN
jgi:DNA polymerase kappa